MKPETHKSIKGTTHKGAQSKCKRCFKAKFGGTGTFYFDVSSGGKM